MWDGNDYFKRSLGFSFDTSGSAQRSLSRGLRGAAANTNNVDRVASGTAVPLPHALPPGHLDCDEWQQRWSDLLTDLD
jgi:hypothetical protein